MKEIQIVFLTFSGLAALSAIGFFILNAIRLKRQYLARTQEEWDDINGLIPFFGGILVAISLKLSCVDLLERLWWIPFLVDPFSNPLVVIPLASYMHRKFKKRIEEL